MKLYADMTKTARSYYKLVMKHTQAKYVRESLLGVGILVAVLGGYVLHNMYVHRREGRAFAGFNEAVQSYNAAVIKMQQQAHKISDVKQEEEIWKDAEVMIDAVYQGNSSSNLAPYMMMYQVQILLDRGESVDDVLPMFHKALSLLPKNSPLYAMYEMKRIKMSLDSKKDEVKKAALVDLTSLSQDQQGFAFEEALYVLGLYHFTHSDLDKAKQAWTRLVKNSQVDDMFASPWVTQAKEKLEALGEFQES